MAKEFNVTGTCIPARHYMADISEKVRQVMVMVEQGRYFTINRPRQYGKTTMLFFLFSNLNTQPGYLVIKISFEGIGDAIFQNEKAFCPAFFRQLATGMHLINPSLTTWLNERSGSIASLEDLSVAITEFVTKAEHKIVLLIDEVDKSSNNQLFVSFLGMLRNKYLHTQEGLDRTFHSVVLAGVHDVRTLKIKLRPDEETKLNSPWNIASDFKVEMSLQPREIVPMLEDYAQEQGVSLDAPALAERLYYHTSGYPFLVSALCKILAEDIVPAADHLPPATATVQDVDDAANRLIRASSSNTNFDSLIKNLENNEALYQMTFDILMGERSFSFNIHNPVINLGIVYGIFREDNGVAIQNRVYQQVIYNYLSSKMESNLPSDSYVPQPALVQAGNRLDMEKVLLKFQEFMRSQYNKKDRDFLERNGRLVFLAYLRPILNGAGHEFVEAQLSEERRLDVAITFYQHKYVAELKVWRGDAAHQSGLAQLADYLDRQGLDEGYLIVFDHTNAKTWKNGWTDAPEGKRVFEVWV